MVYRSLPVALALVLFTSAFTAGAVISPAVSEEFATGKYDAHLDAWLAESPANAVVPTIVMTHGAPGDAADAARALGASVTWEYTIIDGFAAKVPQATLDALAAREDVQSVWLDRAVEPIMDISHRAIEADKGWAAGVTGAGVTVAVLDTGIDTTHPFFSGAIVSCVSTIGGLVAPDCTDSDGHGTHVAGTVASRDTTYPGVAPDASLAVVRVLHALGAGTSADIIAGMEWVANNQNNVNPPIRVATMSIGYVDPGCGDDSDPMAQAANSLVDSGIPFTVAAGNSGHNSCTIDGASAASKVTTIAAVDDVGTIPQDDDVIADFSSGGGDGLQKPDVSFPGVDITSAYIGSGILIATMSGTSMATPHAAGTAALLLQAEPGLSAQQVKDRITGTAVKTANTGSTFNTVYGHGLGNACRTLQLNTCGETAPPPEPLNVHVDAIDMSYEHQGRQQHRVTAAVTVVDDTGAAVSDATVTVTFTSPEGNTHSGSATTDATGLASITVRQKDGGHGTWNACVDDVTGVNLVYDSAANVETCESLNVS